MKYLLQYLKLLEWKKFEIVGERIYSLSVRSFSIVENDFYARSTTDQVSYRFSFGPID